MRAKRALPAQTDHLRTAETGLLVVGALAGEGCVGTRARRGGA